MSKDNMYSHLRWDCATAAHDRQPEPQGILVPDAAHKCDKVAVVYTKGHTPPEITVQTISGAVQTVLADGIAVAVVARASGPMISPEDVLLVERYV